MDVFPHYWRFFVGKIDVAAPHLEPFICGYPSAVFGGPVPAGGVYAGVYEAAVLESRAGVVPDGEKELSPEMRVRRAVYERVQRPTCLCDGGNRARGARTYQNSLDQLRGECQQRRRRGHHRRLHHRGRGRTTLWEVVISLRSCLTQHTSHTAVQVE